MDIIRSLLRGLPDQNDVEKHFAAGEVILEQGQVNDELLILVEGEAKLIRTDEGAHSVEVDAFASGSILGITSFWSKQVVFARVEAISDVLCVAISRQRWEEVILKEPKLMMSIQALFVSNLSSRYRNMIQIHVERDRLSRQLELSLIHI